jgi:hypothetical protein
MAEEGACRLPPRQSQGTRRGPRRSGQSSAPPRWERGGVGRGRSSPAPGEPRTLVDLAQLGGATAMGGGINPTQGRQRKGRRARPQAERARRGRPPARFEFGGVAGKQAEVGDTSRGPLVGPPWLPAWGPEMGKERVGEVGGGLKITNI